MPALIYKAPWRCLIRRSSASSRSIPRYVWPDAQTHRRMQRSACACKVPDLLSRHFAGTALPYCREVFVIRTTDTLQLALRELAQRSLTAMPVYHETMGKFWGTTAPDAVTANNIPRRGARLSQYFRGSLFRYADDSRHHFLLSRIRQGRKGGGCTRITQQDRGRCVRG